MVTNTRADERPMVAEITVFGTVDASIGLHSDPLGQWLSPSAEPTLCGQQITDPSPLLPVRDPREMVGYLGHMQRAV